MFKTLSLRGVLGLSFAALLSQAVIANDDLTPAEANTIVKEDIASAQVMAEFCPAIIGKSTQFDANIKQLIQSYLTEYVGTAPSYENLQQDSEYKTVLGEARQAAKDTEKDEQKSVCEDVLNYEA